MNLHALGHEPFSNYAYAFDTGTYHIRLKTAKDDIKTVFIRFGDPYEWEKGGGGGNLNADGAYGWKSEMLSMEKETSTELFDYWFINLTPKLRRLRYGFILEDYEGEKLFFGERKIIALNEGDKKLENFALQSLNNFFCLPFLNAADVYTAPSWVKETVWYHIFPERFNNGDSSINPEGTLPWGSVDPTATTFFGGDLQGIIDKLDYLQELGITGIYMCPIFKSPSTHKYNISDYFEIDPNFGDKATFKRLVDTAHQKGIRIMLDVVFNHSGVNFAPWQDVLKNQETSHYFDWFHIRKFPLTEEKAGKTILNYDSFSFSAYMPKMKTENPQVSDYFIEVAKYWTKEFDIDGWRLDVANEVDHVFWRRFAEEVRIIKKDIYILGEVWRDARPWLSGDQFDAVMNYPLTEATLDFISKNEIKPTEFMYLVNSIRISYMQSITEVNFNLLESHDTARLLTLSNGNKAKMMMAYAFIMSQAGAPCIYYGSEVGMDGGADPLCRKCMVWDEKKQDRQMFNFFKKIITLRKTTPALRRYDLSWVTADDEKNFIIFKKSSDTESIYVILNNNKNKLTLDLKKYVAGAPAVCYDLITDTSFETNHIVLGEYQAVYLKL